MRQSQRRWDGPENFGNALNRSFSLPVNVRETNPALDWLLGEGEFRSAQWEF
jgi:hypothetical protein